MMEIVVPDGKFARIYNKGLVRLSDSNGLYYEMTNPRGSVLVRPGIYDVLIDSGNDLDMGSFPFRGKDPWKEICRVEKTFVVGKAAIAVRDKRIMINPTWWETLTTPQRDFVLAHEVAHLKTGSNEIATDALAAKMMLGRAYNASQIWDAIDVLKGPTGPDRKSAIKKKLLSWTPKKS